MIKSIDDVQTLGIIGLAKNTGKTTTLNAMLNVYNKYKIGLTSIGLDGEDLDQVNFLPKPKIHVKKGMIVATACACLEASDIPFKILEKTELMTSLGKVKIIEVLEDGTMVIAGPTTNRELHFLIEHMKKYVDKVFVDGAFNRMTFANIKNIDAICLATGASVSQSMIHTIEKTRRIVESFNLDKTKVFEEVPKESLIIKTDKENFHFFDKKLTTLHHIIQKINNDNINYVYIKGAITQRVIDYLIEYSIKNFVLICDDATKLLFSDVYFQYIENLNIKIEVIHQCPLIFVTINPFSPIGKHYDADLFLSEIKKVIKVPIYNVEKEFDHV
ncbi:MAG: hypothetical protein NUK62_00595 [Tenericutes bacterium]|nr:hypothetical protein [Mycoplasmatota bacterium]